MNLIIGMVIVATVCGIVGAWALKRIGAVLADWLFGRIPGGRK